MCLLITATEFPEEYLLRKGEDQNRDGNGIAYLTSKGVKYFKGITMDDLLTFKGLKAPMLIHFRIASIGPKCDQLCHPFPISKDASLDTDGIVDAVIGHNGTVSSWREFILNVATPEFPIPSGEPWSDTRALAYLAHIHGTGIASLLADRNKIAILSDGTRPRLGNVGINRWGEWTEYSEGVFTSQPITRPVKGFAPFVAKPQNMSGTNTQGGNRQHPNIPTVSNLHDAQTSVNARSGVQVVTDDDEEEGYRGKFDWTPAAANSLSIRDPHGHVGMHSLNEEQWSRRNKQNEVMGGMM